jgi:hypothetical protein
MWELLILEFLDRKRKKSFEKKLLSGLKNIPFPLWIVFHSNSFLRFIVWYFNRFFMTCLGKVSALHDPWQPFYSIMTGRSKASFLLLSAKYSFGDYLSYLSNTKVTQLSFFYGNNYIIRRAREAVHIKQTSEVQRGRMRNNLIILIERIIGESSSENL